MSKLMLIRCNVTEEPVARLCLCIGYFILYLLKFVFVTSICLCQGDYFKSQSTIVKNPIIIVSQYF